MVCNTIQPAILNNDAVIRQVMNTINRSMSNCYEEMTCYQPVLDRLSTQMDFDGKVVLITGASSGIGAACALEFAKLKAQLILTGRNLDKLNEIAAACEEISKTRPAVLKCDVTVDEDVENTVKKILEVHEKLDVIVNNAGVADIGGVHSGVAVFDRILATNLRGPFYLTTLMMPHLIQSQGCVVNISSALSVKPNPILTPYCISKAGLDMMTKCLALEFGCSGVRVNSVNPGPVKTEIFKRAGLNDDENQKLFTAMEAMLPLRKITSSDEVAYLVAFLASDKAKSITGSCYSIDCGLLLGDVVKL